MKIDFTKHEAKLKGEVIRLQCNSSGHYYIPLTTFYLIYLLLLSNGEKKTKAK